jgi:hypothetical protein
MRAILAAVAVLVLAASASAKTLKVPRQYPTIQDAVDAAAPGDTILVSKGTYSGTVHVNTPGLRLVGKKAILDGNVAGVSVDGLLVDGNDVTVQGFEFRNGNRQVVAIADRTTVSRCVFRGAGDQAVLVLGEWTVVTGCRVDGVWGYGIRAVGNSASVTRNTVRGGANGGIVIDGEDALVDRNLVTRYQMNGIVSYGPRATVTRNRVTFCNAPGIVHAGDDGLLASNTVENALGYGIVATGDRLTVEGNSARACQTGMYLAGDDLHLRSNESTGTTGDGFVVEGDGFEATDNVARGTGGSGFCLRNATSSGGGLVKGNLAQDSSRSGFRLDSVRSASVEDNRALDCGTGPDAGFLLFDVQETTLARDEAAGSVRDGFVVQGGENTLVDCVARDCVADGFDVAWGSRNTLRGCTATGNGGEGLDNGGADTTVDGGTYLDNRIDIAQSGGSFHGGLTGVKYGTGGTSAVAEVD